MSDSSVPLSLPSQATTAQCRFFQRGFCFRGDKCWYKHDPTTVSASAPSTSSASSSLSVATSPLNVNADAFIPTMTPTPAVMAIDEDVVCNICFEAPEKFGLLDCNHVYCLTCIREWRTEKGKTSEQIGAGVLRKCPVCRTVSDNVIPSDRWLAKGPLKDAFISSYKDRLSRIPCRYFADAVDGRRSCPFGYDCFYQHLDDDGRPHQFQHGMAEHLSMARRRRAESRLDREVQRFHQALRARGIDTLGRNRGWLDAYVNEGRYPTAYLYSDGDDESDWDEVEEGEEEEYEEDPDEYEDDEDDEEGQADEDDDEDEELDFEYQDALREAIRRSLVDHQSQPPAASASSHLQPPPHTNRHGYGHTATERVSQVWQGTAETSPVGPPSGTASPPILPTVPASTTAETLSNFSPSLLARRDAVMLERLNDSAVLQERMRAQWQRAVRAHQDLELEIPTTASPRMFPQIVGPRDSPSAAFANGLHASGSSINRERHTDDEGSTARNVTAHQWSEGCVELRDERPADWSGHPVQWEIEDEDVSSVAGTNQIDIERPATHNVTAQQWTEDCIELREEQRSASNGCFTQWCANGICTALDAPSSSYDNSTDDEAF